MKDYKLSEVKEICKKNNKNCEECGFFNKEDWCCEFDLGFYPSAWDIDKKQDPKDNPENYKEINDKLC